jgi:hypothetical protein
MSSLKIEIDSDHARASSLSVGSSVFSVELTDGRTVMIPLDWYPRLLEATERELNNYRFIGDGEGIHWPDLDEDIRIVDLLAGKKSQESKRSLHTWSERRRSNIE